ncbi:T9SS type B sorting domain-containing protein, partial [Flavobacterium aquatile]
NPTIADIQVNEPSVTWYNSQTSTTALASTDALVNGSIYYGSITDAFGCVSSIRLEVTISISNGTTPTTNSATQTFCQSTNPTIADIQVNEPNVTWYNSQTSTTALASTDALVEGVIYYASIIDGFGCASSIRLEVTIDFTDEAAATITGGSTEECSLNEITYTATTGMTNYIWTVSNGTITSGGLTTDDFVTVSWPTVGAASISVTFDNNCGLPSSATLNLDVVVCSDLTITKTVDNATPSIDDNVTFTITVNNVGSSQLSDIVVNDLLQSGYQFVSATPSVGTYNNLNGVWTIPVINANESATLIVVAKVLPTGDYSNTATIISSTPIDSDVTNNVAGISTEPICLLVYNEFSPNNDGANEFFIIDCIENYPNSKLEVFNRYGVLVYTKNKYINDWDGTANVSGTVNKDDKLPTGTYYYILDLGENDVKKNGWLSIVR